MKKVLETQNLTKRFGGLLAVNNLDFHIIEGEIVGLIGPNGAGKTTLFNLITGFHKPDAGTVKFLDEDITGLAPHEICLRGIARTFQLVKPFPNMTVLDNITVGVLCRTKSLEKAVKESENITRFMGLEDVYNIPVKNLPIGRRKLLELARSLATKPKLLLIDEIVAGLNIAETEEVLALLKKISNSGVTLCLVEHVMTAVMNVSERIVVLDRGTKIAEGTPKEISRDRRVIEAYLGEIGA